MNDKSTSQGKWEEIIFISILTYLAFVLFGYVKCWIASIGFIESLCLPTVAKWTLPILYTLVIMLFLRPWKKK